MTIVHLDPVMSIFERDCSHIDKASLCLLMQTRAEFSQVLIIEPSQPITVEALPCLYSRSIRQ